MDYELCEIMEENDIEKIGEYLDAYGKGYWNSRRKCYEVMNRRFYPIYEDGIMIAVEED